MRKDKPVLKRQTGGDILVKFDKPLKLEEIPTQNKIHVINNYSPKYDYIVEGDKIYYAQKGRNYWLISLTMILLELISIISQKIIMILEVMRMTRRVFGIRLNKELLIINNIRLEDIVTHQNVRDMYNDYAKRVGQKEAPTKPDINERNYMLILQALLKRIYYKK